MILNSCLRSFSPAAGCGFFGVVLLVGCAATIEGPRVAPPPEPFDPAQFLLAVGSDRVSVLQAPARSEEEINDTIRNEKGDARRSAFRDSAIVHLLKSEESEEDRARHRRIAVKNAKRATRGSDDEQVAAEMAFVQLWVAWRKGQGTAKRLSRNFVKNHGESSDLGLLGWSIKGEIDLAAGRHEQAAEAFRYLIGDLTDPLYVYSLYRTSFCLSGLGQDRRGRQSLRQIRQLGCDADPADPIALLANLSAAELGTALHLDAADVARPSTCTPDPPPE